MFKALDSGTKEVARVARWNIIQ